MEQLELSFRVVFPLLVMMAAGVVLRRTKIVSSDGFLQMNRVVFNVGIPCLVFNSLATSDLESVSEPGFTLWLLGSFVGVFVILTLLVPLFEKDGKRRGVLVQGMLRPNDAVFGLAVATTILGEGRLVVMAYAVAIAVPVSNILGIAALELFRGGKVSIGKLLLNIVKNPIIIATVLGFIVNLSGLKLPGVITKVVSSFGSMSAPLGFLVLGGILTLKSAVGNRKALALVALVKLVVMPLSLCAISYALGYRGEQLLALFIIYAAPTAMGSFPIACALDCDHELAGEIVAVTTALSLPSVFLFLTLFGGLVQN